MFLKRTDSKMIQLLDSLILKRLTKSEMVKGIISIIIKCKI